MTMEKNNSKNFNAAMANFDHLDREIEAAYNRACLDKSEQVNRASLNKDDFACDSQMARKRANEFSADIEDLAKLKRQNLKKKVEFLKQQVTPPVEVKVEPAPVSATKEQLDKARNAGMGAGFWIGALTVGGLALYAAYKNKQRYNREVERLHNRINELEKNQK